MQRLVEGRNTGILDGDHDSFLNLSVQLGTADPRNILEGCEKGLNSLIAEIILPPPDILVKKYPTKTMIMWSEFL